MNALINIERTNIAYLKILLGSTKIPLKEKEIKAVSPLPMLELSHM